MATERDFSQIPRPDIEALIMHLMCGEPLPAGIHPAIKNAIENREQGAQTVLSRDGSKNNQ